MDNLKFRYIIVSPRQAWGGAIALHALCKYLGELGYEASILYVKDMNYKKGHRIIFWLKYIVYTLQDIYMYSKVKLFGEKRYAHNKKYVGYINEPVKGCKRCLWPLAGKNDIVVYPEIAYGNFTGANYVVRWLLYYKKYENEAYNKNDMFVAYRDIFNDIELNPVRRLLNVSYFDLQTYKHYNFGERNGKCYIIRKGRNRLDLPKKFDGPIIDDLLEEEKVRLFNESKYCISYDTQTAYSRLSAYCGCISVVIPEEGKCREDYRPNEISYGVAFGFDDKEIDYAISTRNKLSELYSRKNEESKQNVVNFVEQCRCYFFDTDS